MINVQLAIKTVQVAMIALTVVNRVLIIVENAQKAKLDQEPEDAKDVRSDAEPAIQSSHKDSGAGL